MANATSTQLQELYVAYFGRAADPTGLDYWKEKGITTAAFAANMYAQPEFKSAYGSLSIESQVNQIYKNLFDREADVTGLTYWTQQIKLGNLQLAEIANDLIWAAQNNSGSADDKTALTNRTNAAVAYTAKIAETTAGILAYQPLYTGLGTEDFSAGSNITEAINYLSGINKDTASTAAGIATSVATITTNGIPSPNAKTYTLTTGTDTFSGSTGKDIFQGVVVADLGTGTTITSGDSVVGNGGLDTFNISVTSASTAAVEIIGVNADVEKILFSNFDTNSDDTEDHVFDASLSDGLTTVGFSSSAALGDTGFTNVKNIVNAEMFNGAGDLTITHIDTAVSGTSDSMTLTVSGQTAGTFTETSTTAGGIETINVVSKGSANTVDITSTRNSAATLNITGDQNLTTTVASTGLKTVDASAFTGKLDLTQDVTADLTLKGGSGDDTFTFSSNHFTSADTVDGGAGTDVLEIATTVTAATFFKNVSNVETVKVTGSNNVTLAADANVMNFDFTEAGASQVLTLNTGVTAPVSVTLGITNDDDVVNSANTTLTVKGSATAITTADLITGGSGTDTIEITADTDKATEGAINMASQNFTNIDKVVLVDAGDATTGATKLSGKDIELTTGSYATALTVDGSALDAANKDSNSDGTIDNSDASAEQLIFDGSSATAKLTVTGGGAGDELTGGTKDDTIDGGGGNDTITLTAGGKDNVKGGAGDDKFVFGTTLTKDDVVDGGAGTDTLSVTTLTAANLAGVTNVETLAFTGTTTLSSDLSFDTIDLTDGSSNDKVTFATGYTKATTVNLENGDSAVNAAKISMTVTAKSSDLESGDTTVITGSSSTTNDSITITAGTGTVATSSRITNVDSITVKDGGDATSGSTGLSGGDLTINLENYATALTIDASALDAANKDNNSSGKIDNSDASAEILTVTGTSAAALTITGGGAGDSIKASDSGTAGDTIKTGGGDDVINMHAALTYTDTIDGGAGTDTMQIASDISDVAFMNVTNVETLTINKTATTAIDLGAYFSATGITKVNLDTAVATVTATGATKGITFVSSAAINEVVTGGLGDDVFEIDGVLTNADTFVGGPGTDTLLLDNSGGAISVTAGMGAAGLSNTTGISGIEKITFKDADGGDTAGSEEADNVSITLDGESISGIDTTNSTDDTDVLISIDGSVITDSNDAITVNVSDIGDPDYVFTITGGPGGDTLKGGGGPDTITAGAGIDAIEGNAGADTIDGGDGVDTITGGAGQDSITTGAGKDIIKYTLAGSESTLSKPDTITDFTTGDDTIRIAYTMADGAETADFTFKGTTPNVSEGIGLLSGVKGQYVFNTSTNSFIIDSGASLGLLQSGDDSIVLTGLSTLADGDIAFDITTSDANTGAADTVTTGGGDDTVVAAVAGDSVTTGKGDDTISTGAVTYTGTMAFGDGTDTLKNTTGATDVKGATVSGLEKIEIAASGSVQASVAQLATFNSTDNFTVTGVSGNEAETLIVAGASAVNTIDGSALTLTNANLVLKGHDNVDTITGNTSNDYLDGHTGDDIDTLIGGAGNDTYNLADRGADDILVEEDNGGTDTIIVPGDFSLSGIKVGTTTGGAIANAPLAEFEQIVLANNKDLTVLAAQVSGQTIKVNTATGSDASLVNITGADADSTINLAGLGITAATYVGSNGELATGTAFNAGDDKVILDPGTGQDIITLPAGMTDELQYALGDSGTWSNGVASKYDSITGFDDGVDLFNVPATAIGRTDESGALTNTGGLKYANVAANGLITFEDLSNGLGSAVTVTTATLLAEALTDVNILLGGATRSAIFVASIGGVTSSYLYQGKNGATTDLVVEMVGVTAAGLTTTLADNTLITLA